MNRYDNTLLFERKNQIYSREMLRIKDLIAAQERLLLERFAQ